MTRIRFLLGLGTTALAVVAAIAAGQALIQDIKLANGSPGLLFSGLISPALMAAAAALSARLAYRNLFWRRYLASVRGASATISSAPPNER